MKFSIYRYTHLFLFNFNLLMSFTTASSSSNFTARELRRYRFLFRARDLSKVRDLITTNQSNNVNGYTVNILAYVSRGPLSPNNRSAIRKEITPQGSVSNVQLSLFPTSLSQYFTSTSYLQNRRSLFKGSTFQRVISFKVPSDIKGVDNVAAYIKTQAQIFFANLNKVASSENGSAAFNPIVIFFPTQVGSIAPRRFCRIKGFINEPTTFKENTRQQINLIESSSQKIVKLVTKAPQLVVNKLTHPHKRIWFLIKYGVCARKS